MCAAQHIRPIVNINGSHAHFDCSTLKTSRATSGGQERYYLSRASGKISALKNMRANEVRTFRSRSCIGTWRARGKTWEFVGAFLLSRGRFGGNSWGFFGLAWEIACGFVGIFWPRVGDRVGIRGSCFFYFLQRKRIFGFFL